MGVIIGCLIILLWFFHLYYILNYVPVNFTSPVFYLHILIQAYLYTGLFITGHDAMHRTVSKNRFVNDWIGRIATFLFAGMSYKRLIKNHFMHHKFPGEGKDPDFNTHTQNFFLWWLIFLYRYTTLVQLIIMAITFNLLKIRFKEISVWMFWVIPAFLGTFQLFYFGTYLPHKKPHTEEMQPHNARTLRKNHLIAMLTCYFFGYHHEHHESPGTPWWKLYQLK
uniref:Fatty acid desaturase n=1 Tax=Ignavibacterium album TaxID=591197 RepID=A0A7V3E5U6_9BACT